MLYKVDGEPVTLMDGGTPAYRTLAPGITDGADVLELNRNLARLGFDPDGIVVDDVWQAATTVGVELFQESLGETPTGTLAFGQVVFLPGPQLVSTVDGTLGADGGGGSGAGGSSGTSASVRLAPARPEFVSLTTTSTTSSGTATAPATSTPTTTTPITSPTTTTTATTTPPPKRRKSSRRPRRSETHHGSGKQLGALIELLKAEIAQLKQQHAQPRRAARVATAATAALRATTTSAIHHRTRRTPARRGPIPVVAAAAVAGRRRRSCRRPRPSWW